MPRLDALEIALSELEAQGLLRQPGRAGAVPGQLFACSNDYLGLGAAFVSRETVSAAPTGAGASRLIHGTHTEHLELEHLLATWTGSSAALLFSSGYAANAGLLSALCSPGDRIISDALNHASIIDGCRLSRAEVAICRHLDLDHVEQLLRDSAGANARWVVVESYYSMDGDSPDLPRLRELCSRHDAFLIVDEAHALGVFGPRGAGLCAAAAIAPDVLVGTLGKAVGVSGAFVAGTPVLRTWLWNRARSFVFSTAPPPFLAAMTARNVERVMAADAARQRLLEAADWLRGELAAAGAPVPKTNYGPILPLILGASERALVAARAARERGVVVQPIRPPTVPPGSARLRVTVHAGMTRSDLATLARVLLDALAAARAPA